MTTNDESRRIAEHRLETAQYKRRAAERRLTFVVWIGFPCAFALLAVGAEGIVPNGGDPLHWFHLEASATEELAELAEFESEGDDSFI